MKKIEDWKKKFPKTASVRIPPLSFSIDHEIDFLSKEIGINDTTHFNEFMIKKSGLDKKEYVKRVKEFLLNLSNIKGRKLSQEIRKDRAEKIKEEHPRKEVQKRMEEYLNKKEYE